MPVRADTPRSDAAGAARRSDLRPRFLSALVLAPAGLACIWFGAAPWAALVALAAIGLACEWVALCGRPVSSVPGLALLLTVLLGLALAASRHDIWALAALLAGFGLVWALSGRWPLFASGTLYIGITAVALLWLRADAVAGLANVLFVFLVVWASDIGAYAVGRTLGGPKLAPRISPGKTWSGAIGGVLAAVLAGLAVSLDAPGDPARTAAVAAALAAVSQAGDLLESALKRRFGRKDSGRLIPGHGGLLDRLDGVLAAAPAAALLALFLGHGVYLWR